MSPSTYTLSRRKRKAAEIDATPMGTSPVRTDQKLSQLSDQSAPENEEKLIRLAYGPAIQIEATSLKPFTLESPRSNKRYNSFQTHITKAAAQAHEAAITRPREYLGASVNVSTNLISMKVPVR